MLVLTGQAGLAVVRQAPRVRAGVSPQPLLHGGCSTKGGPMSRISDLILSLRGWVALLVVFLLPALEASVFFGFLFPGEVAVILGGVLAFQHRITLGAAII